VAERIRGVLASAGQIICFPIFWFLAFVICRGEVHGDLKLPKGRKLKFVIAANHQSALDPFVMTGVLAPKYWLQLLPYRYITANQYLYKPKYIWFLWPLGGFPAYPTRIEGWGLKRAQHILNQGQTICIFPEGQRALKHEVKPKRGVSVLASTDETFLLTIRLEWKRNPRKEDIHIGQAYTAQGHTPEKILDSIYSLPNQVT
jgi:1-acyl-sn-glycerol-3-phosphate acyltransferase